MPLFLLLCICRSSKWGIQLANEMVLPAQQDIKIADFKPSQLLGSVLFVYFLFIQIALVLQVPFIQIDFAINYYLIIFLSSSHYLYKYLNKNYEITTSSYIDLGILFLFLYLQPSLVSYHLVILLVFLFLTSFQVSQQSALALAALSSVSLSLINLTSLKWVGSQNIFSLALFNFSFFVVTVIAQSFKNQFTVLQDEVFITQKRIRSREELTEILVQKMPSGLIALDSQKNFVFQNEAFIDDLQLNMNDILKMRQQIQNQGYSEIQYYNSKINEKRIYDIQSNSYFDEYVDDTIDLFMVRDMTEYRHLQEQVKHREKLAAIGQLAAGIAHEIRNPLAGISGSIQLLSNESQSPDDLKLMKIILKEIDRLNNLITEFLDYSKPEIRPDQKVDLSLVLSETLQNIKISKQYPEKLDFKIQLSNAYILGYSDKLKQCFLNIIMNAIHAMTDVEKPQLSVLLSTEHDHVLCKISDNGQGMSEETRQRIFEPFFTTKSKGTGLGLAITHKVLESHLAEINVKSEKGQGTEFVIKFRKV